MNKILLIIERDSYEKDTAFIHALVRSLESTGYQPAWYNPHGVGSSQLITSNKMINALPKWIRFPVKIIGLLAHPKRLKHYLSLDAWREGTIEGRCKNLKKYINRLDKETRVAILSRSAGGRIASLVADELGIEKLICLGYPFKHPEKPIEPERFIHLANLKTPFLIIQGTRDEYGGLGLQDTYQLSPQITVEFIDANHDFTLSPDQFDKVSNTIKKFLEYSNLTYRSK